jgi:hypothetical protein
MLRHSEKLPAATQHGILLPTSRPTTMPGSIDCTTPAGDAGGSESATLHIRIDLTGIGRRRDGFAAIPARMRD